LATGPQAPATMFDHLYAELPAPYLKQREAFEDQAHA
jgi:hypothetical protein